MKIVHVSDIPGATSLGFRNVLNNIKEEIGESEISELPERCAWFVIWSRQILATVWKSWPLHSTWASAKLSFFVLVALATPIASKPVQCTDLVDASESCWGEKKIVLVMVSHSSRGFEHTNAQKTLQHHIQSFASRMTELSIEFITLKKFSRKAARLNFVNHCSHT